MYPYYKLKKKKKNLKEVKKIPLGPEHFNLYDTFFLFSVSHNRLELLVRILHVI